jgi:hypothetical protein
VPLSLVSLAFIAALMGACIIDYVLAMIPP